jgi:hypothetical protein
MERNASHVSPLYRFAGADQPETDGRERITGYRVVRQRKTDGVVRQQALEATMGFGRGLLLWLIGIPLPIIILLALFWHH